MWNVFCRGVNGLGQSLMPPSVSQPGDGFLSPGALFLPAAICILPFSISNLQYPTRAQDLTRRIPRHRYAIRSAFRPQSAISGPCTALLTAYPRSSSCLRGGEGGGRFALRLLLS